MANEPAEKAAAFDKLFMRIFERYSEVFKNYEWWMDAESAIDLMAAEIKTLRLELAKTCDRVDRDAVLALCEMVRQSTDYVAGHTDNCECCLACDMRNAAEIIDRALKSQPAAPQTEPRKFHKHTDECYETDGNVRLWRICPYETDRRNGERRQGKERREVLYEGKSHAPILRNTGNQRIRDRRKADRRKEGSSGT